MWCYGMQCRQDCAVTSRQTQTVSLTSGSQSGTSVAPRRSRAPPRGANNRQQRAKCQVCQQEQE